MLNSGSGEEVASYENELEEDLLELLGVGVDDFIFLEGFQVTEGISGSDGSLIVTQSVAFVLLVLGF